VAQAGTPEKNSEKQLSLCLKEVEKVSLLQAPTAMKTTSVREEEDTEWRKRYGGAVVSEKVVCR
jgi:hypothetical protein